MSGTDIYIDTSALVALYIPEQKSDAVQNYVTSNSSLSISSLTQVEFCSAVSRRVRMKDINKIDGRRIISQFQLHVKDNVFTTIHIWQKEYDLAEKWISNFETPLRSLDAIHLALSFSNNQTLLTSDKSLASSAKQFAIKTKLF